jgi:hypothetical protein
MKDAEPSPVPAQPRKRWSTPTVILSTVGDATGGFCHKTQNTGQVDHKNPTSGSTSVES